MKNKIYYAAPEMAELCSAVCEKKGTKPVSLCLFQESNTNTKDDL